MQLVIFASTKLIFDLFRILRAKTGGFISKVKAEWNHRVFDMTQIREDSKEEMEVFQVKFRHVQ